MIYNNDKNIIFNTFQNYLKSTKARLEFEQYKNKKLNMRTCVKMVRGAYIREE